MTATSWNERGITSLAKNTVHYHDMLINIVDTSTLTGAR